jgi:hypothetical protein
LLGGLPGTAGDHSEECWWLLDGGRTYRIIGCTRSPLFDAPVAWSRPQHLLGFAH